MEGVGFELELTLARACAAACEELVYFASLDDAVSTLGKMVGGTANERVWRVAVFCCSDRARPTMATAWLLHGHDRLVGWPPSLTTACERLLDELSDPDEAARGFAALAHLFHDAEEDAERAAQVYEKRCRLSDPATLAHYASVLAARGDVRGALGVLERLPERAQLYYWSRGCVFDRAGNWDAALDALDKCAPSAAVLMAQSRVLLRKGLKGKALARLEQAAALRHQLEAEEATQLLCDVAVLRSDMFGETAEAMRHLRRRLAGNASDDRAWLDLARVQCDAGDYEAAKRSIDRCRELRDSTTAANQCGLILLALGRISEAAAVFEQMRQRQQESNDWSGLAASLFNLADANEQSGKLECAADLFAQCAAIEETSLADPVTASHVETLFRLSIARAVQGRTQDALSAKQACLDMARRLVGSGEHAAVIQLSVRLSDV